ncbi:MAG: TIR domain-containing protein [Hyphomonadaceae bacterium]|nr:TIR domain-containing protein [Hyphomonadaceae bacterium]
MADVFLSYARQDTARAIIIRDALQALGLSVFFDTEGLDGGDVFPDVLDREVKGAGAVVGVWSRHALSRPWVKVECDIGRARGVLVPVQIEEIPDLDRPAAFWNVQFDDLSDFDGDTEHAGWLRFVRSLARTLNRPDLLARESQTHTAGAQSDDAGVRAELQALRAELAEMHAEKGVSPAPAPKPGQSQTFAAPAPQPASRAPRQAPTATDVRLPRLPALLIAAVAATLAKFLVGILTTPMLIRSMMANEVPEAQVGLTLMGVNMLIGLVLSVLAILLAKWLHARPGTALRAAIAVGVLSYLFSLVFNVMHLLQYGTSVEALTINLAVSAVITVLVTALAALIALAIPIGRPVNHPGRTFD